MTFRTLRIQWHYAVRNTFLTERLISTLRGRADHAGNVCRREADIDLGAWAALRPPTAVDRFEFAGGGSRRALTQIVVVSRARGWAARCRPTCAGA